MKMKYTMLGLIGLSAQKTLINAKAEMKKEAAYYPKTNQQDAGIYKTAI